MNDHEYNDAMGEIRKDIDKIDSQLMPLFIERMKCSERVAKVKAAAGKPVLDRTRERAILDRIEKSSDEYGKSLVPIYRTIMAVSRQRQHERILDNKGLRNLLVSAERQLPRENIKVLCQGVKGAYSHKAAGNLFGDSPVSFTETWQEVFEAVKNGSADFGVVPVENSAAGAVNDVYTLIMQYRLYIVAAGVEKIRHCSAALKGHGKIKKVVSHPQGLMQCSSYIEENGYETLQFSNTAAAAKYVAEEGSEEIAAICSEEAALEYGLEIIESDVQNAKQNATRFAVISAKPIIPEDADKISLCFSLPHESGSLYNVLEVFAMHGLNLTKIESRPIYDKNFEYDFYLDFTGNVHNEDTCNLICALSGELPGFSFLGNYKEQQEVQNV